jgi:heme-degrading monooxygenase HmoA
MRQRAPTAPSNDKIALAAIPSPASSSAWRNQSDLGSSASPADRDAHVIASAAAVRLARQAPGCLDFAVSADPVDPTRVNVLERWARPDDLDAFRASGDPDKASCSTRQGSFRDLVAVALCSCPQTDLLRRE